MNVRLHSTQAAIGSALRGTSSEPRLDRPRSADRQGTESAIPLFYGDLPELVREGNRMIVRLPFPPSELMPNRSKGVHWAALSKVREKYRNDAFNLAKATREQSTATETFQSASFFYTR